jgi:Spy/CpxP family protein refolding chaperone
MTRWNRWNARSGNWKIWAAGAIAIAAVATAGQQADARPGGSCGGGKGAKLEHLERGVSRLGLPQQQLESVYQVIDQARVQRRAFDGELNAANERMRTLLEQDAPSVEAVTAQADSIGVLQTEARKVELRALVQVRNLLSPEQWQQLESKRGHRDRGGPKPEAAL